jgi:hypothetical protein
MARERDGIVIQNQMAKWEVIAGLESAIDNTYRRFRETAREEWERRWSGNDPSDACVSVRIGASADEAQHLALPRAGYLPKRASPPNGEARPRLA